MRKNGWPLSRCSRSTFSKSNQLIYLKASFWAIPFHMNFYHLYVNAWRIFGSVKFYALLLDRNYYANFSDSNIAWFPEANDFKTRLFFFALTLVLLNGLCVQQGPGIIKLIELPIFAYWWLNCGFYLFNESIISFSYLPYRIKFYLNWEIPPRLTIKIGSVITSPIPSPFH